MNKETTLFKLINLWALGKVLISALLVYVYMIKLYFSKTTYYLSFLTVVDAFARADEVIMIIPRDEYLDFIARGMIEEESEEPDKDTPQSLD